MEQIKVFLGTMTAQEAIELARAEQVDVAGKYPDSNIVFHFNPDNETIFATDVDAPEDDIFMECHLIGEFQHALQIHGCDLEDLGHYFESLLHYSFSNYNETGAANLYSVLV